MRERFVKLPKTVQIYRKRRILRQRLKVPPALNQLTKTLDKNLDMATGSFAKQLEDFDVTEVEYSPIDLGDDFNELMKGSKTSSSTVPSEKRSHKRRRYSDNDDKYAPFSQQLGEMASAIKSFGQSGVDYSQLYNEVMKVDGYDEVSLRSIFDYLVENEKIGKTFMVKSVNLKKVWIDKFLAKGEQ